MGEGRVLEGRILEKGWGGVLEGCEGECIGE